MSIPFLVISNWNNDLSWINDYTCDNYIIYDKSNSLQPGQNIIKIENLGYNIRDIFHFIVNNYDNLPDYTAFLEGNPFDHCSRQVFDKIIHNKKYFPIEEYDDKSGRYGMKNDIDFGYMEQNNSWYILAHNNSHKLTCKYASFDDLMNWIFIDYNHIEWIRFSPGGQYIVPKDNILKYSKDFWLRLMNDLNIYGMCTEAHIYERALHSIFIGKYTI